MYEFTYRQSGSVDEAVAMFNASEDAQFLAGGMTLLPTMKQRLAAPEVLIDLNGIDSLSGIEKHNNTIVIGAMATHAEVAESGLVQSNIPALAYLASVIGDPQVRNRGTLGGSVANADPAADYPAAVVGLNATIQTSKRELNADNFFTEIFETALDEDELITCISFPIPEVAAYSKFPNPASGYPIVGVFVCKTDGSIRVAVTGAGGSVFRQRTIEESLARDFSVSSIDELKGALQFTDVSLNEDMHASAEYRAHLVSVMARRAVDSITRVEA